MIGGMARLITAMLRTVLAGGAALVLAASAWLMATPHSDQPVLDVFEGIAGFGAVSFLSASERATYEDAIADTRRFTREAEALALRATEHRAGPPVGAERGDGELERIVVYQHSFEEMAQGERFVEGVLRGRARERERFMIGVPAAGLSLGALALAGWLRRQRRTRGGGADDVPITTALGGIRPPVCAGNNVPTGSE